MEPTKIQNPLKWKPLHLAAQARERLEEKRKRKTPTSDTVAIPKENFAATINETTNLPVIIKNPEKKNPTLVSLTNI